MHDAGEFWSHLSTPEKLIFGLAGLGLLVFMVYKFRSSSASSSSGQQGYQVTLPPTMPAGVPSYDPSLTGAPPAPTPPAVSTTTTPGGLSFVQLFNYGLASEHPGANLLDANSQAVVNYWETLAQFNDSNPAYQQWVQGGLQQAVQNMYQPWSVSPQQESAYFNSGAQFLTDPALVGQGVTAVGLISQDPTLGTGSQQQQQQQSLPAASGAQQQPTGGASGLLATPFSSVPHLAFSPVAGTQLTATPFYQPH